MELDFLGVCLCVCVRAQVPMETDGPRRYHVLVLSVFVLLVCSWIC
jgi:hypothetical protein